MGVAIQGNSGHAGQALPDRLDAHTKNMFEALRTGVYLFPFPVASTYSTALTANRLVTAPFIVGRDITIDRLAIEVTSAAAAGKIARLGIYKSNGASGNLYPGDLVLDASTVAIDSTGVKAISINQSLTKGFYYLAISNDAAASLREAHLAWAPVGSSNNFTIDNQTNNWIKDNVGSGALSDPFPTSGVTQNDIRTYLICYRVSSLD